MIQQKFERENWKSRSKHTSPSVRHRMCRHVSRVLMPLREPTTRTLWNQRRNNLQYIDCSSLLHYIRTSDNNSKNKKYSSFHFYQPMWLFAWRSVNSFSGHLHLRALTVDFKMRFVHVLLQLRKHANVHLTDIIKDIERGLSESTEVLMSN